MIEGAAIGTVFLVIVVCTVPPPGPETVALMVSTPLASVDTSTVMESLPKPLSVPLPETESLPSVTL